MINNLNRKARILLTLKWIFLFVIISIAYIIATTGGANSPKPILLIPIVICISLEENELVAGIVGAFCGLLIDMSCGKLLGSNAVFMLITGVLTSLLFLHVMRKNFFNVVFLTIIATIIHGLLDIFFYFAIWNYEGYATVVKERTIPSIIFTIISTPIIYFIIKFIISKFTEPEILVIEENGYTDEKNKLN